MIAAIAEEAKEVVLAGVSRHDSLERSAKYGIVLLD